MRYFVRERLVVVAPGYDCRLPGSKSSIAVPEEVSSGSGISNIALLLDEQEIAKARLRRDVASIR